MEIITGLLVVICVAFGLRIRSLKKRFAKAENQNADAVTTCSAYVALSSEQEATICELRETNSSQAEQLDRLRGAQNKQCEANEALQTALLKIIYVIAENTNAKLALLDRGCRVCVGLLNKDGTFSSNHYATEGSTLEDMVGIVHSAFTRLAKAYWVQKTELRRVAFERSNAERLAKRRGEDLGRIAKRMIEVAETCHAVRLPVKGSDVDRFNGRLKSIKGMATNHVFRLVHELELMEGEEAEWFARRLSTATFTRAVLKTERERLLDIDWGRDLYKQVADRVGVSTVAL
jgi:hypothetical protein